MAEQMYKGYRISPLGTFPMVKIQAQGSGDIPSELKGVYTTPTIAMQAIDRSLSSLKKGRGRKKNVAEPSTTTD